MARRHRFPAQDQAGCCRPQLRDPGGPSRRPTPCRCQAGERSPVPAGKEQPSCGRRRLHARGSTVVCDDSGESGETSTLAIFPRRKTPRRNQTRRTLAQGRAGIGLPAEGPGGEGVRLIKVMDRTVGLSSLISPSTPEYAAQWVLATSARMTAGGGEVGGLAARGGSGNMST